ncbi:MAG: hypothetical protein P4M00_08890 [Azospirillaceae bacterium]|nr:hypothetical protein [Azospirillaceae bacterium]
METLFPIDGGAILVRPDIEALVVIRSTTSVETLPEGLAMPDGAIEERSDRSAVAAYPPLRLEGAVRWEIGLRFLGKAIRIRNRLAEVDIGLRRRIAHLAEDLGAEGLGEEHVIDFDLTADRGSYTLWKNGRILFTTSNPDELAGEVCNTLLTVAVAPQQVALFVHAAGLVIDGATMMLCAPSGGGKTTLALGLAASGATLLTDDTVAIVKDDFSVVGLPVALRVRASGWPVVERLLSFPAAAGDPSPRGIRHIPPRVVGETRQRALPAAVVVALFYRAGADCDWQPLDAASGLAAVIAAGAVLPSIPDAAVARTLGQWCQRTRFVSLTYGSLEDGIRAVHAIGTERS